MYLILPQQERVPELGRFLKKELSQMGDTMDPLFKQLLDMAHSLANETSGTETFSSMIKAIWSYNLALRNYESKYCDPDDVHGSECIKGMGPNLVSMIMNEIKVLNDTIDQGSFQSLNGFRINFDEEHYLSTNRFALKAITTQCEVVDMGFFEDGVLLSDDHAHNRNHDKATEDSVKASQSNFISSLPRDEAAYFQSDRADSPGKADQNRTSSGPRRRNPPKLGVPQVAGENVIKLRPIPNGAHIKTNIKANITPTISSSFVRDKSVSGRSLDAGQSKFLRESSRQIDRLYNHGDVLRQRYTSFFSWLGWAWTVVIVSMAAIGVLVALYAFTYIMMKSCEGAIKKCNQDLASFHLLSIIIVYFSAVL